MADNPMTIEEGIAWLEENGPRLEAQAEADALILRKRWEKHKAHEAWLKTPAGIAWEAEQERRWDVARLEAFAEYLSEEAGMIDGFLAGLMLQSFAIAHNVEVST